MFERQKFTGGPWEEVSYRAVPARVYRRLNWLMKKGAITWDDEVAAEKYVYRFLWSV